MAENKIEEEKERKKKMTMDKDMVIKIITGLIMLGIVVFLVNKNAFIFKGLEKTLSEDAAQVSELVEKEKSTAVPVEQVTETAPVVEESNGTEVSGETVAFNHRLITPAEYKEKLDGGEYIHIDIRTPGEYNTEKIAEGLNIDFYATDFKSELNKLDKGKKYIYHCRSGSRSANSVSIFKELGFGEVLELQGGINNWKVKFDTL